MATPRGTAAEATGMAGSVSAVTPSESETSVLHVGGLHYASQKAVVEDVLRRVPGVLEVAANPVAQTATVTFHPAVTSIRDLQRWVEECGYHCAGRSVPGHICDPLVTAETDEHVAPSADRAMDAHGHGHGGHAGMSMDAMVRDMRGRFLVALLFTMPIVLWSDVGKSLWDRRWRHRSVWSARSSSCSSASRSSSTRPRSSSEAR